MKRPRLATPLSCFLLAAAGFATVLSAASATDHTCRLPVETGPVRAFREIDGAIWIGADKGLFVWDADANALRQVPSVDRVVAISSSQTKICIATDEALLIISPGGGESIHVPTDTGQISTLHMSGETLWMGGERGLFRWPEGGARPELVPMVTGHVTAILETPAALWVGSNDGLFHLLSGARIGRKSPVETGAIGGLHRIPEGIWVDAENGQFWWKDDEKEPSRITKGTGVVFAIREARGRLLIGAEKGLFEWTPGKGEPARIAFPDIPVTGISADGRATLVGTREGVFLLDGENRHAQLLPFSTGAVNGIYGAATDYWISAGGGLFRIGESDLAEFSPTAISSRWIILLAILASALCLWAYWILFGKVPSATLVSAAARAISGFATLRVAASQFIDRKRSKITSLRLPVAGIVKFPAGEWVAQGVERRFHSAIRSIRGRVPNLSFPHPRLAQPSARLLLVPVAILTGILAGEGLVGMERFVDRQRTVLDTWIRARAPLHLDVSLRPPFTEWQGPQGWSNTWSIRSGGGTQPGRLALLTPTIPLVDYQFKFLARIEQGGIGWAVRGIDVSNYCALRLQIERPGARPFLLLAHYPVISGEPGAVATFRFQAALRTGSPLLVRTEVQGNTYRVYLDGDLVSSWTDGHFARGGIGFFSDRKDSSRIYQMTVSANDDHIGRLCAWLSPAKAGGGRTETSDAGK